MNEEINDFQYSYLNSQLSSLVLNSVAQVKQLCLLIEVVVECL